MHICSPRRPNHEPRPDRDGGRSAAWPVAGHESIGRAAPRLLVAWVTLLAAVAAGCGSEAPPTPTGPSATSADLVGEWVGLISPQTDRGICLVSTWTPTPRGSGATGPFILKAYAGRPGETLDNPGRGTMTAELAGGNLSLTIDFPPGGIPGDRTCSMTGTGTARADSSLLSGPVTMQFTAACIGTFYSSSASTDTTQRGTLVLRKGGSIPTRPCD